MNDEVFYEIALKYLAHRASAEETELLKKYLLNVEYLEKYNTLSEAFRNESTNVNEFSLERGLKKLRYKIEQSEKRRVLKFRKRFAVAASIVVFLGLGVLLNSIFFNPRAINYISVSSPIGERIEVLLPDSSLVFLNSGATLSYPESFQSNQRNVKLAGEAFFKVKRNVKKPFQVQSGNFTTTVLGTSFSVVNKAENDFQVTVRTGKVRVENRVTKKQFILEKNNQVVFNNLQEDLVKRHVNASKVTDWHKNILRFDAITAKEAFSKIEQWYNVKVLCKSDTVLNRKIRAAYKNEPVDKVLKSLEFMIGIEYTIQNDSILIK
ncbi:FecR family protein [Aestuariibaculum marinum]|uniref:FecR domain-containing protein n=1 Tax=Aestuariibaculum marinum TaxID=2683592 RepID=A0A8J6U5G1_9FLAO|nr:FecR family protein [Aestuariibaculum marinum]MBD0824935.1 FecR domain-containing protein [Aestuariibaculum marinum]